MGFGFFFKGSEEIGLGRGLVFLYLVWVLFMVFFLSRVQVLVPIGVCGGDLFFWFLGFKSDGHRLDRGSLGCLFLYLLGSQRVALCLRGFHWLGKGGLCLSRDNFF